MGEWVQPLCGCLSNCTLCLITWIVPCYTAGKNAEAAGTRSCIMVGVLYWLIQPIGIYFMAEVRGKIREQHGIEGSFLMDCLMHWFCSVCAMQQDAAQLASGGGQQQAMARE